MLNILTKSTLLKKGLKQPKVLKCASLAVLETNNPLTKKREIFACTNSTMTRLQFILTMKIDCFGGRYQILIDK